MGGDGGVGPRRARLASREWVGGGSGGRGRSDATISLRDQRAGAPVAYVGAAMNGRLSVLLVLCITVAACAGVLGVRKAPSHPFEHRAHVSKGINCVVCHTGVTSSTDQGQLHLPSTDDC